MKRGGKVCFDQTCVERAVPSTCVLGNVEHFSGQPSAFRGRELQKVITNLPSKHMFKFGGAV